MEKTLTKVEVKKGDPIEIRFSNPSDARAGSVDGVQLPQGTFSIQPPAGETDVKKVDIDINRTMAPGGVHLEVRSGNMVLDHIIPPGVHGARFRFVYEESSKKLIYCSKCDDLVIADAKGKCPIHQ